MGKYQFGKPRLIDLGLMNKAGWIPPLSLERFLGNAACQEATFIAHVARYLATIDHRYMTKYGMTIDGIPITASGLVAAAHLVGLGSVNQMIRTGTRPTDGNGMSAVKYLAWMGDFDLPRDMPMQIPKAVIF
jgi:hypothetical protein